MPVYISITCLAFLVWKKLIIQVMYNCLPLQRTVRISAAILSLYISSYDFKEKQLLSNFYKNEQLLAKMCIFPATFGHIWSNILTFYWHLVDRPKLSSSILDF